ncbi:MAG TPA: TonB-dependent receptor [Verrucomicrobiae bacterium]|nr:TonB-dependent receptor [Verrucomicrobiae bacterium]
MKPLSTVVRRMFLIASSAWIAHWSALASPQTNGAIQIAELRGTVELLPHGLPQGAPRWLPAVPNLNLEPHDRLRTGPESSVAIRWSDSSVLRFGALTELEILPPSDAEGDRGLHLLRGILSFFHRGKPGRINVITSGGVAGIEGTEFVVEVGATNGDGQTRLSVIDGKVRFTNAIAGLVLTNGEQAVAAPGKAPARTAGFIAKNVLQWCFYYPGVLDVDELPAFTDEEQRNLGPSLAAYRDGDLFAALTKDAQRPRSDAGRIYHAALLLGVGEVAEAEEDLSTLADKDASGKSQRLAAAVRTLIAAVKREARPSTSTPRLATERLADSYLEQSRAVPNASLAAALALARQAVAIDPKFGFAWERVAELEFSFGHIDRASEALDKALALSPRNAQALALKGFLLAAEGKSIKAIGWFNRAMAVDPGLGDAWLGRGLCRIRYGDLVGGREDLLVAAAMEPQRASLRSYLAKAWSESGNDRRAMQELQRAETLDPSDPTAWLYSALINEEDNRLNDSVRDLEKSEDLNTNRSVYRSQLLLDQDSAVRSANLARIYQEEGMDQVALREGVRAVNDDYANYSGHLFLANSYNALRDPNDINLRYETPTYVEYLVGNLLAPVNAGVLSPSISQEEYSRLFDRDRIGIISESEYLSRGAWTESGGQYGTTGDFSYDLEGYYRTDPGQWTNNAIEQRQVSLTIKEQFTPQDTFFGMVQQYSSSGGDLRQYYNITNVDTGLKTQEQQNPLVLMGYHHEWTPGSHTLFLAGRLQDAYQVQDTQSPVLGVSEYSFGGPIQSLNETVADQNYTSQTVIYTAELQQIWEHNDDVLIGGLRFQDGDFKTQNYLYNPEDAGYFPGSSKVNQNFDEGFERVSAYGYYLWRPADSLQLTAGLSYDWMTFPEDFRSSPITSGMQTETQLSPKAGFVWTPWENTVVRAAYTRSIGGASLEQSFQLEPSQVAGFNQLFRSVIPESIEGDNAGARFETWGFSVEQKLGSGTYLGLTGQLLNSTANRESGVMIIGPSVIPSDMPEHLDFHERDILATVDQLIAKDLAVGVSYQLTEGNLLDRFTQLPADLQPFPNTSATLHQVDVHARFSDPSGFFAQFEALWTAQSNDGYTLAEPSGDFWQLNVLGGYRFPRNHAELTVGVLNLTGQNYKLNPLTEYNELPLTRTLMVSLKLDF